MSAPSETATTQFLTFRLDNEVFAFEISKVREVLDFTAITRIPAAPGYMPGVINLRGAVVPVVDLRQRFGMAEAERTADTCIIITEAIVDNETTILGALADSVQEVIDLDPAQIEPPPRIGAGMRAHSIRGMGKQNGRFIIILELDQLFSGMEFSLPLLSRPAEEAAAAA
jgi:purine-binding chemotaxis protein CheW